MVNILLAALHAILLAHVYRLYLLKVVTEVCLYDKVCHDMQPNFASRSNNCQRDHVKDAHESS